jgi:preprotein translocase subunit SecG
LGVPKALLDHYLSARLSERVRWIIAIAFLVILVILANAYIERQHAPRHLSEKDRSRLKSAFNSVKAAFSKPIAVSASAGDGEAAGYAQEFIEL